MIPEQRSPIRVFLLDDHEIVRRGIKELLESEGDIEVVGESGLAQEAARRIPALKPDVAILDGRLPDGSGIDVCRQVRSVDPTIAGLILTSYDDDDALFAAIMAGAAGYILSRWVEATSSTRYAGWRLVSRPWIRPSLHASWTASATAPGPTRSSPR
jgi:DNA-binding NarL/FixJ family response regulator